MSSWEKVIGIIEYTSRDFLHYLQILQLFKNYRIWNNNSISIILSSILILILLIYLIVRYNKRKYSNILMIDLLAIKQLVNRLKKLYLLSIVCQFFSLSIDYISLLYNLSKSWLVQDSVYKLFYNYCLSKVVVLLQSS